METVVAWLFLAAVYIFVGGPLIVASLWEGPPPRYWECFWRWHGASLVIAVLIAFAMAFFWAIDTVAP